MDTMGKRERSVYDRIDIIYHANTSALTLQDIRTVASTGDGATLP